MARMRELRYQQKRVRRAVQPWLLMMSARHLNSAYGIPHVKLAAWSLLLAPFHLATLGYGQSNRVRTAFSDFICEAIIDAGAMPCSTHCSSAVILSNRSVAPSPPWQCII